MNLSLFGIGKRKLISQDKELMLVNISDNQKFLWKEYILVVKFYFISIPRWQKYQISRYFEAEHFSKQINQLQENG